MAKRILFLSMFLAASAFANAAPSVWEQMQTGQTTSVRGLVKSVEIAGSDVLVEIETRDAFGERAVRQDRLCRPQDGVDDNRESEEIRAALLKSKIDLLQEARRTGQTVELGTQGPFKPCVSFVRASRA